MKILVTGSAGFVGQSVVRILEKEGHDVIGVDVRPDSTTGRFIQHDLTLPIAWKEPFDLCIHLASAVGGFLLNLKADVVTYNQTINENVVKICQAAGCKHFIFFSTINVFEKTPNFTHGPLAALDQITPYAQSKGQAEHFFTQVFSNCMILRPTNIFGSSQRRNHEKMGESHVIPDLLKKISESDQIVVFGDGSQVRNFVHVNDIVKFIMRNLEFSGHLYFNLRSDITISIRELVTDLIQMSAKPVRVSYDPSHMKYEYLKISNFDLTEPIRHAWVSRVSTIKEGLQN